MRQIISEGTTTYVADYIYHENGTPLAFAYYPLGGTPVYYFYELTLQGDIVGIYDANGAKVVGFRYNAWGSFNTDISNSTVCTDTFLRASLFRYRSYIYDHETNFYYLQSRYYDPETGRFINADGYVSTGQGLLGNNMYAYCGNNPVMNVDYNGNFGVVYYIAAFANDIYQIVSRNVTVNNERTSENTAEISNSYKLLHPITRLGYSIYLNHFNKKTKDVIKGSSLGVAFEWWVHNIAYAISAPLGLESIKEPAKNLNVAKTIFSDDDNRNVSEKIMSIGMQVVYTAVVSPIIWISELIINEKKQIE